MQRSPAQSRAPLGHLGVPRRSSTPSPNPGSATRAIIYCYGVSQPRARSLDTSAYPVRALRWPRCSPTSASRCGVPRVHLLFDPRSRWQGNQRRPGCWRRMGRHSRQAHGVALCERSHAMTDVGCRAEPRELITHDRHNSRPHANVVARSSKFKSSGGPQRCAGVRRCPTAGWLWDNDVSTACASGLAPMS